METCLIYNANQIVRIAINGDLFIRGQENLKNLHILSSNSMKGCLNLVIFDEKIEFIGYESDLGYEKYKNLEFKTKIDARGCCILPGLIDSHTHPIWEGDRVHEFKMKLEGATYMDIHKEGGGIHYSVRQTTLATETQLYASLMERLKSNLRTGTTFMECKTGYGLEWTTELKLLKILTRANRDSSRTKPNLSITYLGAHALQSNKSELESSEDIVSNQIPRIKELRDRHELDCDNIDVFCEKNVFELQQTQRILQAGKDIGLQINFHGDELYPLDSVILGVDLDAKGISHLEEISDREIERLSNSNTVGILLPTTAYILRLKQPPARKMIDSGCIVALGSDFNPNAYCHSMPIVMHLACINMRMTLSEVLIASTLNSAFALGVSNKRGSIERGKQADLLLIEAPCWEHLIYRFGCHDSLIKCVLIDGQIAYEKK